MLYINWPVGAPFVESVWDQRNTNYIPEKGGKKIQMANGKVQGICCSFPLFRLQHRALYKSKNVTSIYQSFLTTQIFTPCLSFFHMFFPSRAQIILSFVHTWHSGTWHGLQVYLNRKHAALTSRRIFFESMGRMKDFDIRNPMPQKAWEFFEVWMSLFLHLTKKNEIKKVDESSRPFSRFQNLMDFTGKSSRCQKKTYVPSLFFRGARNRINPRQRPGGCLFNSISRFTAQLVTSLETWGAGGFLRFFGTPRMTWWSISVSKWLETMIVSPPPLPACLLA